VNGSGGQLLTDCTRTRAGNKGGTRREETKMAGAKSESGVQRNPEEYK